MALAASRLGRRIVARQSHRARDSSGAHCFFPEKVVTFPPGLLRLLGATLVLVSCTSRGAEGPPGCPGASHPGAAGQIAVANCLAEPGLPGGTHTAMTSPKVILYIDRSASMRGFLDPEFPSRVATDYRSVIDGVAVGLAPDTGYSFGKSIRGIRPTLATLSSVGFYSDGDTKMEDVFAAIRERGSQFSHVIIGDGRRGSPASAIAQFVAMRELAVQWVDSGGTFFIAVSNAPFTTVDSDPSGCRAGHSHGTSQTCPLYAFAFARKGDEMAVATALASAFQRLFAWPILRPPPGRLRLAPRVAQSAGQAKGGGAVMNGIWAGTSAQPIPLIGGPAASNSRFATDLTLLPDESGVGKALGEAFAGDGDTVLVSAKPLTASARSEPWKELSTASGVLLRGAGPREFDFVTFGNAAPRTIFRFDVASTGVPSWLEEFDASDAGNVERTYGLARLFEAFRLKAANAMSTASGRDSLTLARMFAVAY